VVSKWVVYLFDRHLRTDDDGGSFDGVFGFKRREESRQKRVDDESQGCAVVVVKGYSKVMNLWGKKEAY
jgi:hypothetical protein